MRKPFVSKAAIEAFFRAKDLGERAPSPRVALTLAFCESLPGKAYDYEIKDSDLRNLSCRVRKSGRKSLDVAKKIHGRNCRSKVCDVGTLAFKRPSGSKADTVHSRARKLLADMELGQTATVKRAERAATAAHEASQSVSVLKAVTDYIDGTERAENTTNGYKTMRDNHLSPWGSERLSSITPDMVVMRHKAVTEERGGTAANNCMRLFRAVWLANRRALSLGESPTYILSSREKENPHTWTRETRRERRIHISELDVWWKATERLAVEYRGDGELGRDYLRFVLFTGMRRREVSNLTWANINFKRKTLTITENKAGRELTIPLTNSMIEILERRKDEGRPFQIEEPRKFIAKVVEWSDVEFSVHDLRRSFASIADELEISMSVLKSLLNHSTKSMANTGDVTLGYVGQIPEHRKRKALEKIERFILSNAGVVSPVVEGGFTNAES